MTFLLIMLFIGCFDIEAEWTMFKHVFKFKLASIITMLNDNESWIHLEWDDEKERK